MSLYQELADLEASGKPAALVTVVETQGSVPRHAGSKMIVYPDGSIRGTIGGGEMEEQVIEEALAALRDRRPRRRRYAFRDPAKGDVGVCGGEMEVFVEPVRPPATIVVIGCGHVGQAVARLASWLGYQVIAVDDRPEYSDPQVVPEADEHVQTEPGSIAERVEINPSTHLLLTTRAMDLDVQALPALLETPAAYIGVIGSRRRWATTARALAELGVAPEKLERVVSPMGLELNAETPEEIALSMIGRNRHARARRRRAANVRKRVSAL